MSIVQMTHIQMESFFLNHVDCTNDPHSNGKVFFEWSIVAIDQVSFDHSRDHWRATGMEGHTLDIPKIRWGQYLM